MYNLVVLLRRDSRRTTLGVASAHFVQLPGVTVYLGFDPAGLHPPGPHRPIAIDIHAPAHLLYESTTCRHDNREVSFDLPSSSLIPRLTDPADWLDWMSGNI